MLGERRNNDQAAALCNRFQTLSLVVSCLLPRAGRRGNHEVLRQSHAASIGRCRNAHQVVVNNAEIPLALHARSPRVQAGLRPEEM